jgi:hypothetical protein
MKKLKSIMFTVLAISLLAGVLSSNCLALNQYYLPLISSSPPPPPVTIDQFVGSWAVSDAAGATIGYLFIGADGSFVWADVPDIESPHFSGTGSVVDGTFLGPFTNPGVGDGDLICKIDANGVMNMDFVEHWHTPDKIVQYTAVKF